MHNPFSYTYRLSSSISFPKLLAYSTWESPPSSHKEIMQIDRVDFCAACIGSHNGNLVLTVAVIRWSENLKKQGAVGRDS